jgi:hypothetical protein
MLQLVTCKLFFASPSMDLNNPKYFCRQSVTKLISNIILLPVQSIEKEKIFKSVRPQMFHYSIHDLWVFEHVFLFSISGSIELIRLQKAKQQNDNRRFTFQPKKKKINK